MQHRGNEQQQSLQCSNSSHTRRTGNPFLLVQHGEADGVDVGTALVYDGDAESAAKWMRIAGEKLQKFEEEEIENLEKEYDGY